MKDIAIYGVGDFGQRMFDFLQDIGCKVELFIQSTKSNMKKYKGVPILSIEEYFRKQYEFIVFIAINDANIVHSIYELFVENQYDINKIFDCRSFIADNYVDHKEVEDGDKLCNLCGHHLKAFLPSGINTQLFSELNVIGGGYRQNVICPYCGCLDRNRWVYWVLKEKTNIFKAKQVVLHFAPEKMIQRRLQNSDKCDYYAGDIVLKAGNHKIDVTKIPFQNDFFDYILINHVLEHVEREKEAFCELRRVIKPDGKLILSFPITLEKDTIEKEGIRSEQERLKYYGQKDHVRLYGKDYKNRIEAYGWKVQQYVPECLLDKEQIEKHGFLKNDILIVCSKE